MRVGILGSGEAGQALGTGFVKRGHDVKLGSRDPKNPRLSDWTTKVGGKGSAGTFADAAKHGEIVVVCTLGTGTLDALRLAGPANFKGKLVIDTTNPLDLSKGIPPGNFTKPGESLGASVQKALPGAKVVKCFNTVPHVLMFEPKLPGGAPEMLICGDDAGAKKQVEGILKEFGWPGVIDVGGIQEAKWLEDLVPLWVRVCLKLGTFNVAARFVRGSSPSSDQ